MSKSAFSLDPQLVRDCHVLGRKDKIRVLLHRNAALPWFILVPETSERELCHLPDDQRQALSAIADHLSRTLLAAGADKINVAAIGNLVPQLHYHVVGRRRTDPAWPGVVWGRLPETEARTAEEIAELAPLWDELELEVLKS